MGEHFDVVIIGSGFGGAVTACRLAQDGARVLVLERGRRWSRETYPRRAGDPWLFKHHRPEKWNGWLDLRLFRRMVVAQGAGIGGGSLCYSSVVMEAGPETFEDGWPPELTLSELEPYYEKVRQMMAVRPIPDGQNTHRFLLMKKAAEKLGWGDRFAPVPLALSFDPDYSYDLPNPLGEEHSKPFVNPQGQPQGTCVHLGNCDIG
ncbi:MAG: NAD(P)-binding protein, partial [Holophagales bacterium]|nr:NAD(P)-binding protein [Holophagales bacterium]